MDRQVFQVSQTSTTPCTPSPLTTHPPRHPPAGRRPGNTLTTELLMLQMLQQMAPCPVVPVGTWVGEGRTSKQNVALAFGAGAGKGEIRKRPRCCGVGENWLLRSRNHVAAPKCAAFAAFAASSLHQLPCWDVGVALVHASRVGGPGQNGSRLGPSSTETLLQFPQNPPAKRAGAIHDAVASSEHGSMESWEGPWVSGPLGGGRLETRQSHGFKISRLNLAGPCRRLDGLGCCPALRLLGAPFPDPSSTTTHTTHAHGTRRPSSSKRPWLEPGTTGWEPASWPFLDGDRRLRPRGCHTLVARSRRRRCANKDMAPPFFSC